LIDTSTAPNSAGLWDGIKSAPQYQALPTGRQAEQIPGLRPGIVEGLILETVMEESHG